MKMIRKVQFSKNCQEFYTASCDLLANSVRTDTVTSTYRYKLWVSERIGTEIFGKTQVWSCSVPTKQFIYAKKSQKQKHIRRYELANSHSTPVNPDFFDFIFGSRLIIRHLRVLFLCLIRTILQICPVQTGLIFQKIGFIHHIYM